MQVAQTTLMVVILVLVRGLDRLCCDQPWAPAETRGDLAPAAYYDRTVYLCQNPVDVPAHLD